MPETPTDRSLPDDPDDIAPDGSLVRLLVSTTGASMAHFELGPGRISIAQRHRSVAELWYVLGGQGQMWRRSPAGEETEIVLTAGVSLTIPVGTAFQFRCDGEVPFTAVGLTVPPWPGPDEAVGCDGRWPPALFDGAEGQPLDEFVLGGEAGDEDG